MRWKRVADRDADQRETRAVTAWMKDLASLPVSEAPLPDVTYLWWKAELLRRWDAERKATEPIEVGEQLQVGIGLVTAGGVLVWLWRTLPGITTTSTTGTSLTAGLAVCGILLAATAAALVRDLITGA
jgi:hypothetical protein